MHEQNFLKFQSELVVLFRNQTEIAKDGTLSLFDLF